MLPGVTDLRMLDSALGVNCLLVVVHRSARDRWPVVIGVESRRGLTGRRVRAAVREAGLQHERLPCVGRESLPNGVYLLLHIGHWPRVHDLFQHPHVPREVLTGIRVQVWIWRSEGDLELVSRLDTSGRAMQDLQDAARCMT